MKHIVELIILLFPTWFEVYSDRNGDKHPNNDWMVRGLMCICVGGMLSLLHYHGFNAFWYGVKYTASGILLFTGIFPYWINFVQLKNGVTSYSKIPKYHIYSYNHLRWTEVLDHIVNHLSDSAWPDKTKWWRVLGWFGRLVINLILLTTAILLVL